ncbi:hypothetical protein R1T43_02905 [Alteromonas sp. CI.11.F.A3]|uniref:hypothetical protein n=1 Tax=Alteromonas sp. CI.11.F.A3 TaxID=3079555 RepID=UPI002941FB3B|nr:hypothetical protein [Alteromonas sp. CI.11.F.A3]WOI38010.1 hypothetical protein R1T43_02905 [Alteromonas sp. CI.11.F.A3]
MQHNTQNHTHKNTQTEVQTATALHLETQELLQVTGGKSGVSTVEDKTPIRLIKPPVYITLAIGEDGGQLPDLLS